MNYNRTLNLPKTKFSMKANLSSKEPEIQKFWEDSHLYMKLLQKNKNKTPFILHDGPPYANGHIHMGHALNRVLKDIVLKYKAMNGYYTPFVPGWDCHGLPIEYELIKKLGTKQKENKVEFRKKASQYALNFVDIQKKEFKRLGLLGDWDTPYLTLNSEYEEKIIDSFKELYLKGYIYRALKPVYWCSSCHTALAEAEVEYHDIKSPSVYVKFEMVSCIPDFVKQDEKIYALIWTTTPWTLPSNVALCFHPGYNYSFIKKGKEYLIVAEELINNYHDYDKVNTVKGIQFENCEFRPPFGDRKSKGIAGEFVTLEDGTGIVHIAPGHGEEDYLIGRKYGLPIFSPVDGDGKFIAEVGIESIVGKHVFQSDSEIINMMDNKRILFKREEISHSYPHCWRCKNPIIFRATKQWFLSVDKDNLRQTILKRIKDVKWYPEVSEKRIRAMIENRPDWCLSRQRLWGVPIPVFYCKKCQEYLATQESFEKVKKFIKKNGSDGWFRFSAAEILGDGMKCKCGSTEFTKKEDILDVWFDSGVSHFAVLETRKELRWPADMYLEGSDQHRGWFQTSLIPAVAIRGTPPYRAVFTHGFVVDAEGKKMSKSLGNVISPQEVIKKYGADVLRLWVASENYFKDIKMSEEILAQIVTYYRRIRNTFRFILGNTGDLTSGERVEYEKLTSIDKFILHKFYHTAGEIRESYEKNTFYKSIRLLHDFCNIWLSSFYFNILKDRLYVSSRSSHDRRSSQTVLRTIGESMLKLFAPVLSHTVEEAWHVLIKEQNLSGKEYPECIMMCDMPDLPEKWNNPANYDLWKKIVDLRNKVLKKIEEAKAEGIIKDPLESEVIIETESEEILDFLNKRKDRWKEYFIVSKVSIINGKIDEGLNFLDNKINIKVFRAEGNKCVRCWLMDEKIGEDKNHPELCPRCALIVKDFSDF